LFNHLCDVHVGRKRHGNLRLNCSWEVCIFCAAATSYKADHNHDFSRDVITRQQNEIVRTISFFM
ncbi:hypothetical protein CROQUDRAFT_53562, partial [Cronartium quercuum f. sp. fusiforme G11]